MDTWVVSIHYIASVQNIPNDVGVIYQYLYKFLSVNHKLLNLFTLNHIGDRVADQPIKRYFYRYGRLKAHTKVRVA